jgi:hypothetical protein
MPRMDGVAAAREIKRQYPDVKIIDCQSTRPDTMFMQWRVPVS